MTLEESLLSNTFELYLEKGGELEDVILSDTEILARIHDMYSTHKETLKLLVKVQNAQRIKKMVTTAMPVEIIPYRHEVSAVVGFLLFIEKMSEEYLKRKQKQMPEESPPKDSEGGL